jgi:hypothetical protein
MNEQAKALLDILERDRKLMHGRKGEPYEYTARVLDSIVERFIIEASLRGWDIQWATE